MHIDLAVEQEEGFLRNLTGYGTEKPKKGLKMSARSSDYSQKRVKLSSKHRKAKCSIPDM